MSTDTIQPHSAESEEAVLGSLMIDDPQWARVSPLLTPAMFYQRRHAQIYEAMQGVIAKGQALDQITVAHEIDRRGLWDATGGGAYLSHLVSLIPTPLHAVYYAQIVKECWQRRELIQKGSQMVQDGVAPRRNQGVPLQ